MNDKKVDDQKQAEEMLKRIERLKHEPGAAPAKTPAKPANDSGKTLADAESALEKAPRASRVFTESRVAASSGTAPPSAWSDGASRP